jgi:hypothetical protein
MDWATTVAGGSAFDGMDAMMQVNPVLLTQWEECLFTTNDIGIFRRRVEGKLAAVRQNGMEHLIPGNDRAEFPETGH